MSRAALSRQEGNAKERERRAFDLFEEAAEEGRSKKKTALPIWGDSEDGGRLTFHWNKLLLNNTIQSRYFQKCCQELKNWNAVIDEIYYQVSSLKPFSHDKAPSTAFCLLLRLMCLRMTAHQMDLTLKHPDSPYIRGIGFLYLRYTCPPDQMWSWIKPYIYDGEELDSQQQPQRNHHRHGGHQKKSNTIGDFVRDLFSAREYCGTPLPRIPMAVERELRVELLKADKVMERAAQHYKNQERMRHFTTLGSKVMALYGDEENPTEWYQAVVDRVIYKDEESGFALQYPRFVVTFPDYGNTETVTLGEMDVMNGDWRRDQQQLQNMQSRHGDLYEEVRQRERDQVTADKGWAPRRPPTTKSSLSSGGGGGGGGRYARDEARWDDRRSKSPHDTARSQEQRQRSNSPKREAPEPRERKKRTAEEEATLAEKKRRLMARYG